MQNTSEFSVVFACIASFLSYSFGINPALEVLLWACTLDLVFGVFASFINENLLFNSKRLFKGITKKIVLLSLVAFAHQLDNLMCTTMIGVTTTYFFICNESLSTMENAAKCGLPLPKVIFDSLEQLKNIGGEKHDNTRH